MEEWVEKPIPKYIELIGDFSSFFNYLFIWGGHLSCEISESGASHMSSHGPLSHEAEEQRVEGNTQCPLLVWTVMLFFFFFYLEVRSWTTVMVNVPDRLFHIIFHFQSPFSQAPHLCAELHCAEALCPGACCGAGIHSKHRRYSKLSTFQETIQTLDVGISIVWQGSKKDHHFKYKCVKLYLQN